MNIFRKFIINFSRDSFRDSFLNYRIYVLAFLFKKIFQEYLKRVFRYSQKFLHKFIELNFFQKSSRFFFSCLQMSKISECILLQKLSQETHPKTHSGVSPGVLPENPSENSPGFPSDINSEIPIQIPSTVYNSNRYSCRMSFHQEIPQECPLETPTEIF